MLKEFSLDKKV